jgi:hypothetical protein
MLLPMPILTLRPEFQSTALSGTVIELKNSSKSGAVQRDSAGFFGITYPSVDLIKCFEAIAPGQDRSVVLMGGRGQGKSHMMAAVYHALTTPSCAKTWMDEWAGRLKMPHLSGITIRPGLRVIAETLTNQAFPTLWDLLFQEHANGQFYRGKFEGSSVSVPAKALLIDMFTEQPTALLPDEFQTWFDGLSETKQKPQRTRAFNFIQTLSEIAGEHPEKLLMIVSVRDGQTDAYQQLHRINPRVVDFTDPLTKRDRHRLLLHRIFENRSHVPNDEIEPVIATHVSELVRLRSLNAKDADAYRTRAIEAWPFAPTMLDLLDDQVLLSVAAQETRDLIKLLVETFKLAGAKQPVLTAADFRIDLPVSAVGSLLDAVASPLHRTLREKAQKNLESVLETVPNAATQVPHAAELISALWIRSFNTERHAGASLADLQLDITRDKQLDDNLFAVEIRTIREASFNIHEQVANWLVFKNEENPDARLMANARNDKLFPSGEDQAYLARVLHALLASDDAAPYRVVVLPRFWQKDPWTSMSPDDHPDKWGERIPVVVVPEWVNDESAALGRWLKENLSSRRNTVRFLLPPKDADSIYTNPELILAARAAKLAADWQASEPGYKKLRQKYDTILQEQLKGHFHRFAVLDRWHHADPSQCVFQYAAHNKNGSQIPRAIQEVTRDTLFIHEDFEDLVLDFANRSESVGKLLDELKEPRSAGNECIAWLGEREIVDRVETLCAKGKIAINLRGTQLIQWLPGDTEMAVAQRIKGKVGTGNHLYSTTIQKLSPGGHVGGGGGSGGGNTGGGPVVPPPMPPTPPGPGGSPAGGGAAPNPFGGTGSSGGSQVNDKPTTEHHTSARNSALNLTGTLETWGANKAAVKLHNITLRLDDMTGAQLAETLKKLPPGSYVLDLDKEKPA